MEIYKIILRLGGAQFLGAAIAFSFTFISVKILEPSVYGDMRYVMAILPLFMIGTLPTYDSIILRNTSKKIKTSLYPTSLVRFVGGGVVSLTILISLPYLELSSDVLFFLIVVAIFLPFFDTSTGFKNYLIGARLKKQAIYLYARNRLISLLLLCLFSSLIIFINLDERLILPSYLLAIIIPSFVVFFIVAKKQNKIFIRKKLKTKLYLKSAFLTTVGGGLGTLSFSLDKLLIHQSLGAEKLALYAILTMVPLELANLVDSIFPIFYRKLILSDNKIKNENKIISIFIILLLLSFYSVISLFLYPFVFDSFYTFDIILLFVSSLLIISGSYEYYFIHKIYARGQNNLFIIYSAISVVFSYVFINLSLEMNSLVYVLLAVFIRQIVQPLFFIKVVF